MIKILDLYCGGGGCSWGYHQALNALEIPHIIQGVDINPQPGYPFYFHQEDSLQFMERMGHTFNFFHASPPCQGYSRTRSLHKGYKYPELIEQTRAALKATGQPYVMENVPGSPLENAICLDGTMFGLRVIRKRLFEIRFAELMGLPELPARNKTGTVGGKNFTRKNPGHYFIVGGHQSGTTQEWRDAMGIQWMHKKELAQAIPPAYTEWIGKQIFKSFK